MAEKIIVYDYLESLFPEEVYKRTIKGCTSVGKENVNAEERNKTKH